MKARQARFGRRRLLGLGLAAGTAAGAGLLPGLERTAGSVLSLGDAPLESDQLSAAITRYLASPHTLVLDGQAWTIARHLLGLMIVQAPQPGPVAGLPRLFQPPVDLQATVEPGRLAKVVADLPDLERPALNAELSWNDGVVNLQAEQPGRRVDLTELSRRLQAAAVILDETPVQLPMQIVPAATTTADLNPQAGLLQRVLAKPLTIGDDHDRLVLPPKHVAGALKFVDRGTIEPDDSVWATLLKPLASRLAVSPVEPTLAFENGKVRVVPPVPGQTLAVEPTTDAAWDALAQGRSEAAPVLQSVPPRWTVADLAPALAQAQQALERPPVLTAGEREFPLTRELVARLLRCEGVRLTINDQALDEVLTEADQQLSIAPQLPFFRWRDGKAVAEGGGRSGRRLQLDAARGLVATGLLTGQSRLSLPLTEVAFQTTAPENLAFPDVLAEGRTYYGDSSTDRYRNVSLGLARINGALIPPGGLFSFNQASGPVTLAAGFRKGYGIAISNGKVTTLPSVGGGICQVATTVFHAAFRAGMPIVDRSWHLYWMPRYGRPPSGVTGLDATVDDQSGLDFTFTNTSKDWLLVESSTVGGNAVVRLRGVNPGWKVTVEGPFISNIVPASHTMTERKDPSLPAGTRVWVEHAEDGKTVTIRRTVTNEDGSPREQRSFRSVYAPAANVTLVGTGGR